MDQGVVKALAGDLEGMLRRCVATSPEAAALLRDLRPILDDAKAGRVLAPMADIPGDWFFMEGGLRRNRPLAEAYARFKRQVTDADNPAFSRAKDRIPHYA
ncbi:hypothetical protein [Nitrospirillum pindoramense]|uniref:Uncharacterized protein n=1 Tax=Nitrospirillum amazonense TaxID=28077 RepID=A0A560H7T4_9PROT|nr:hypothetical protein [Nitrospirillum amazonense]TWB41879.1 hypothetical protein FBZ90_107255 [Nitrospirillum amazonense]